MALEKTALTEELIRALLAEHYGLSADTIERLQAGSANCYRITTHTGTVFLKEFQSEFAREDLDREARLLQHLTDCGVPVARFLPTRRGGFSLMAGKHPLALQEYAEGDAYGYEEFPEEHLPALARLLGKIHRALEDYPLPEDMGSEWLASYNPAMCANHYDRLMRMAGERADDPNVLELLSALEYKKELAHRCADYIRYYEGITYCGTHGDYQGCQVIGGDDGIRAVVDFSAARRLPVVWEIMRSFVQSARESRQNCVIDVDALCRYVAEYREEFPLTATDLAAMPYVYLFQLARSRYGFTEYLTTDSEDRESLLRFALWRTEMCRYLEEHSEEIVKALLHCYDQKEGSHER